MCEILLNSDLLRLEGQSYCFDEEKRRFFVFGGCTEKGEERNSLRIVSMGEKDAKIDKDCVKEAAVEGEEARRPLARSGAAIAYHKEHVYVLGGLSNVDGWLNDAWRYSLADRQWSELKIDGAVLSKRDKVCGVVMADNKWYLFGGFGPSSEEEEEPPVANGGDAAAGDEEEPKVQEPKDQDALQLGWFDDLYVMDLGNVSDGRVGCDQPMLMNTCGPTARCAASITKMADNVFAIFGGKDCDGRANDVYKFDTEALKWTDYEVNSLEDGCRPPERSFHAAIARSEMELMVFGGRDLDGGDLSDYWIFDVGKCAWTEMAPPKDAGFKARACHGGAMVDEAIIVIGGCSGYNPEICAPETLHDDVLRIPLASLTLVEAVEQKDDEPIAKQAKTDAELVEKKAETVANGDAKSEN